MILDALRHRQEAAPGERGQIPVPVLFSAREWRPDRQPVSEWLARKIQDTYPFFTSAMAAALLASGRITVVLDGLDEISAELRPLALQALSQQANFRLVLLSRTAEMNAAAETAGVLQGAAAIELRLVSPAEAARYLGQGQLGPRTRELRELADRIQAAPGSPLARVLASPLMLSLFSTIYGSPEPVASPLDELLRLPDETAVTERVLTELSAASAYGPGRPSNWTAAQAEGWLASIGSQMRALSTEAYAWRQAAYAAPASLLGVLSGAVTGLGLLVTFGVLGITHHVFGQRMQLGPAIGALAVGSFIPAGAAAVLVASSNSAALTALPMTFVTRLGPPAVRASLGVAAMGGSLGDLMRAVRSEILAGRQGKRSSASSPRKDLARSRWRAVACAVGFGIMLAVLGVALSRTGVHLARDAAIVFVCYGMVVVMLCSPWGSYQLARSWLAARRELPCRLLRFLEDAYARGILRSVGPYFEFRDNLTQGYYADPARLPGMRKEISALADWVFGSLEIREACEYVDAGESDIRQAVGSLATEKILAGQRFEVDAVTRQAALERARVRLNEIGRKSAFNEFLVARTAPGLGAAIDPSRVILTSTMNDLASFTDRLSSASIGISGIRGIGKTTLIRWLCTERNASRRLPVLGVYITAPVEYDARDFLVHLYITLCKAVLADDRFAARRSHTPWAPRRMVLVTFLAVAGLCLYYHYAVDRAAASMWERHQGLLWSAAASVLFAAALYVLFTAMRDAWRRREGRGLSGIQPVARDRLRHLRFQVVETAGQTGSLSGPFGLSVGSSRSRQVTEKQMTLPELVDSYREFAELTVSALQEAVQQDGPIAVSQVRIIAGIDEIDRIENAENAEKFLNDIKAIFGIPNCVYVASLSADALANFERRVVSARTAFDTTFDKVMRVRPLELKGAKEALERRAIGLPYPFITLCYLLSGGIPREMMRIARAVFEARSEMDPGSGGREAEGSPSCSVIIPKVISREVESLRQGLLPLATQLSGPGAAELIELLDDSNWPSGPTEEDMARLAKIAEHYQSRRADTGSAAAAKIWDGLAAASYFFLSVGEVFETRLAQIIEELKLYDASQGQDTGPVSSLHLLARARTAIGINPALALARVRAVREHYSLPDLAPALLS
jgi:hypothetical protein